MSRSRSRWTNVTAELRRHRYVRLGAVIGFVLVSMPAAWLLSMIAR